ncbi:MAG: hypothetical protein IJU76_03315, partial [Desulfovibrionaceae bacterium]|nr:hypothetical protein [Desulfovibrionaceae bacterium]
AYLLVGLLLLCHNQNLQILSRDFLIESRLEGKCKSPQGENNSAAGYKLSQKKLCSLFGLRPHSPVVACPGMNVNWAGHVFLTRAYAIRFLRLGDTK